MIDPTKTAFRGVTESFDARNAACPTIVGTATIEAKERILEYASAYGINSDADPARTVTSGFAKAYCIANSKKPNPVDIMVACERTFCCFSTSPSLIAIAKRFVVAMPINWHRYADESIQAIPGPSAASWSTDVADEALIPITEVSIRLRIGCRSQMPKVGNPNFNKSTAVGTLSCFGDLSWSAVALDETDA